MTYEHKPNTRSLWKNDKRDKENSPHARGDAVIDGVAYFISAWTNETKGGQKYQSLKFSKKEDNRAPNPRKIEMPVRPELDDSDPPF